MDVGPCAKRPRLDDGTDNVLPDAGDTAQPQVGRDDEVITLNVGGVRAQTCCSTLTWSSAYFRNILSGPFKRNRGELFLDCDAVAFAHVLDFFRHHTLGPNAPLRDVHNIAKLYSIDILLDETAKRMEICSMVGTWHYEVIASESEYGIHLPVTRKYTIYEHESALWYHEVTGTGSCNSGKVVRDGGFSFARGEWGAIRLARRGHAMMSNFQGPGEESWRRDVFSIRQQ